jgi:DNA polymerase III epsilon subunit-like protein
MPTDAPTIVRVLDVETSGLPPKPAAVVEIAYVDLGLGADGKDVLYVPPDGTTAIKG